MIVFISGLGRRLVFVCHGAARYIDLNLFAHTRPPSGGSVVSRTLGGHDTTRHDILTRIEGMRRRMALHCMT